MFLPKRTEAEFEACRRQKQWIANKYALWDAGYTEQVRRGKIRGPAARHLTHVLTDRPCPISGTSPGDLRGHKSDTPGTDGYAACATYSASVATSPETFCRCLTSSPARWPDRAHSADGRELAMLRWGTPSSSAALFKKAKPRAGKLEAKGQTVARGSRKTRPWGLET
jgi:hypothetical protein